MLLLSSYETTKQWYIFRLFLFNLKNFSLIKLVYHKFPRNRSAVGLCHSNTQCVSLSLSPWLNNNTLILSYSLHANLASLTVHTQATIYFLLHVIKLGLTSVIYHAFYIFIPELRYLFYKFLLSCTIMLVCVFKVYNLYYFSIKHTLSTISTPTQVRLLIV